MDELDRILMEQADEFVKEDKHQEATAISPWESSISSILWGYLLISFHINLFGFPPEFAVNVLGFLLILKGFCRITAKSRYLKAGLGIALATVILFEIQLVLECTPIAIPGLLSNILTGVMVFSRFALFWLLYKGLPVYIENPEKQKEASEKLKTVLQYMTVNFVLLLIGLFLSGTWLGWPVFILYLVFLYQILKELDETRTLLREYGYRLEPLDSRGVSLMRALILALALFVAIGMPAAMYFSGKSPQIPLPAEIQDGSDRVLDQADIEELIPEDEISRLSDGWEQSYLAEKYFADLDAEVSGREPAPIDPEAVRQIREQMTAAGIDEALVSQLPPSEVLRYEGLTAAFPEDVSYLYTAEEEAARPIAFTSYLCYFEESHTFRVLSFGHWKEKPRGSYTDAVRFYMPEDLTGISDFTGASVGEANGSFFYNRMTCVSLSAFSGEMLLTFPVPEEGKRYDFYLAFNISPFEYVKEEDPDTRHLSVFFAYNIYHRPKLWCYPYQSPGGAFQGSYDFFSGYTGNRIYKISAYYSPCFTLQVPAQN
jgi:hypothetical protein